jgi:hypothetical protein
MVKISLKEVIEKADAEFKTFKGQITDFESAIGALILGRHVGWRILLLVHDRRTIAKYEKLLNVNFRDVLEEVGELAHKSVAWSYINKSPKLSKLFWKYVRGEVPLEGKGQVKAG